MPLLPFLTADEPVSSLEDYTRRGGGRALERARALGPEQTAREVNLSGLRGRGGGGFRTGKKWASVRAAAGSRRFAVCNAAEGEPATFKDRALIRHNPYQGVEGLAVAAFVVGADEAFIGTKAKFERERAALVRAVEEMSAAGLLDGLQVSVVAGPDEYLFGEEKALLEVIEGHDPLPRVLPPFQHGLFAVGPQLGWEAHEGHGAAGDAAEPNPTVVNNWETLANVPHILARGSEWFRRIGTAESPGTIVCTVVGDVAGPGVFEVEMGTPLSELLELAGGPLPERTFKAAFSGVANPVLPAGRFDTALTYEDMRAAGSGLGAGGFAVYDDSACMVEVSAVLSRFLYVESCGQCPPCKRDSGEITAALDRLRWGEGGEDEVELIGARLRTVTDANRCYLGTEEQLLVSSVLETFPADFADHLAGFCRLPPRDFVVPKVDDIVDGTVVYDQRQPRKQPDWTYAEPV
ncbi:MAG: SLBB domain-containing protein [Actinomycetota bacterium]|nr:SLBB domain-containing protein [Actinomycetota bacterium]